MDCPACHSTLIVVERHGIEVDWCLDCRGLWFDEGELELLGEQTGRTLDTAEIGRRPGEQVRSGSRGCPRCRKKMKRLTLAAGESPGVEIDRCSDHGFWLDRGELGSILSGRKPDADESPVADFLGETFDAVCKDASQERRNP
jgi:Zn-finger nucleic acid-binding protein